MKAHMRLPISPS